MGLSLLSGDEGPDRMLILAYGLEEGLRWFYENQSGMQDGEELNHLLDRLARIEVVHKTRIFHMYLTITGEDMEREAFESGIESSMMEGGFTPESFYEQNREALQTVAGVLDLAMMLETQALDLYLRFAQQLQDEEAQKTVLKIADQEKAHLAALGRLRGEEPDAFQP